MIQIFFTKNVSEDLFNKHAMKNIDDLNKREETGYIILEEKSWKDYID